MRKSTSNLGRTESYKQARGDKGHQVGHDLDGDFNGLSREGPQRNTKAYGSMPRLHQVCSIIEKKPPFICNKTAGKARRTLRVVGQFYEIIYYVLQA